MGSFLVISRSYSFISFGLFFSLPSINSSSFQAPSSSHWSIIMNDKCFRIRIVTLEATYGWETLHKMTKVSCDTSAAYWHGTILWYSSWSSCTLSQRQWSRNELQSRTPEVEVYSGSCTLCLHVHACRSMGGYGGWMDSQGSLMIFIHLYSSYFFHITSRDRMHLRLHQQSLCRHRRTASAAAIQRKIGMLWHTKCQ